MQNIIKNWNKLFYIYIYIEFFYFYLRYLKLIMTNYFHWTVTSEENSKAVKHIHETSSYNQLKCLLYRGYLKCKRDPVCHSFIVYLFIKTTIKYIKSFQECFNYVSRKTMFLKIFCDSKTINTCIRKMLIA